MTEPLDRPNFVIIGAMKSATSSIHDQLEQQAGVWMSTPKEPNFFSDEENWARGLSWYRGLFADAPEDAICGESSTHYTKRPTYEHCAERVHTALPDAKLIYVMRDPIDRVVSHFIHAWSNHEIDEDMPIDAAVREHEMFIAYSQYFRQLTPYIDAYGRDRILPVFLERLRSDPDAEFARICTHIGVRGHSAWDRSLGSSNVSAQRQRRHPALNAVLDLEPLKTLRRLLIPSGLRDRIKGRWTMKERPTLSEASLAHVRARLDPDLEKLGAELGITLSTTTFKNAVTEGADAPEWVPEAVARG